jgi:hypothetical protein
MGSYPQRQAGKTRGVSSLPGESPASVERTRQAIPSSLGAMLADDGVVSPVLN